MELARIMDANYPLQTNVPVYDAAALYYGQLIMRSASWGTGATRYYINAYVAGATESEDAVGVLMASSANGLATKENANLYNINADGLPDNTAAAGLNFLPAIVNPGARYFVEYEQTAALTASAVAASTTWAVASLEDDIDSGWLFTTNLTDSSATYPGKLRYATASASGSITADSAVTVDANSDVCKVYPIGHRFTQLNSTARAFLAQAAVGNDIYLENVENWITHSASPKVELRYWRHKGLNNLKNLRVEGEIVMLRHCYRAVVA